MDESTNASADQAADSSAPTTNPTTPASNTPFTDACNGLRANIADLCAALSVFKNSVQLLPPTGSNRGEELANLMLAFRHLEDAAMRIGKAIQANTTGESPLGGPSTPSMSTGGGPVPAPFIPSK